METASIDPSVSAQIGRSPPDHPSRVDPRFRRFWPRELPVFCCFSFRRRLSSANNPNFAPASSGSSPPPILDESSRGSGAGFTGTEGLTNIPAGSFQTDDGPVVPRNSLFRNLQLPGGSSQLPAVGPTIRTEDTTASFKLTLPNINAGVPFLQRGFEPQNADLKLGPFYFKLRALEAAILHSDNIDLTQDNPKSGTIAYVGMTIDVLAQLTENLRLATSVTLVYLPLDGRAGIVGYGLADFYNFGLTAGPLARSQITWDTDIGGWHVVFSDDFQISQGYSDSGDLRSGADLFEGSLFDNDLQARTGRYSLGPAAGARRNRTDSEGNFNDGRSDLVIFSNEISVQAERLDPGSVLLRLRAYHEDLWYNQGNRGLPGLREGATVSVISERENMRFKPYATYDIFRTSLADDWQHIFRVGLAGPITDQLFLRTELGYYFGGQARQGWLWHVGLDHVAGPYTHESLSYAREFNYFHNEINEGVGYNLDQVLGPHIRADAYAYRIRVEDYFDDQESNREDWRFGIRLNWDVGPKTSVQLTGQYDSSDDGTQQWLGRVDVGYNITNTLLLHLVYQYQQSDSDFFGLNYRENLMFLSLTKYFE